MTIETPPAQELEKLSSRLRAAIGAFFVEFSLLESLYVNRVIGALCLVPDQELLDHIGELMDLSNRLKLIKRLATARQIRPVLMQDLTKALKRTQDLLETRNDIAHNIAAIHVIADKAVPGVRRRKSKLVPPTDARAQESNLHSLEDIETRTAEARDLRTAYLGLAERLEKHRSGISARNV
jgi:hypothetical protein